MLERVLLVAWKGSAATQWVDALKAGGYTVLLEDTTGERAWRTAKERGIEVVIIDGQKKPSHGRQTGHQLRDTEKTKNIPIIWTNREEEHTPLLKEVLPDLEVPSPTSVDAALEALNRLRAARGAAPVTPAPIEVPVQRPVAPPPAPVVVARVEEPVAAKVEEVAAPKAPTRTPAKKAAPAKKAVTKAAPAKKAAKGTKASRPQTAARKAAPAAKKAKR